MVAKTPASCKSKGRGFQQEVAWRIREVFGLDECDVVSRSMGSSGADIMLSTAARKVFPFAVECKRQERFRVKDWLKQAFMNAECEKLAPILVVKSNREEALVFMVGKHLTALMDGLDTHPNRYAKPSSRSGYSKGWGIYAQKHSEEKGKWIIDTVSNSGVVISILGFAYFLEILEIRKKTYEGDEDPLYAVFSGFRGRYD